MSASVATRLQPWMGDLLALFGPEECESLLWRAGGSGELEFTVFCSDTFAWACADCEPISAGDLPALVQAKADLPEGDWPTLWVARKRGMRPMRRWLERSGEDERRLLEAAGPERLPATLAAAAPRIVAVMAASQDGLRATLERLPGVRVSTPPADEQ